MHRFPGVVNETELTGVEAILIDDGLVSGCTIPAADRACRRGRALRVIVAVPTASSDAIQLLVPEMGEICCPNTGSGAVFEVADAYREWRDLTEAEVLDELSQTEREGLL